MKIDPAKVYLVKGSTLEKLRGAIRQRTPITSNSQQRYDGPGGFAHPVGTGGIAGGRAFQISLRGGEVFVSPGLVPTKREAFDVLVPRAQFGGRRLDTIPQPSCGIASGTGTTHVHLVFDATLVGNPIEDYFEGGVLNDCWVSLAHTVLPHRLGSSEGGLRWLLTVPIGRTAGGRVISLLNGSLDYYFSGPYSVTGEAETAPTLSLFDVTGSGAD
jgi:hypothetical protein